MTEKPGKGKRVENRELACVGRGFSLGFDVPGVPARENQTEVS